MIKKIVLTLLITSCLSLLALEIEGIKFPDSTQIEGKTFVLNGAGLRIKKVAFIGVKVYAAGLYLENKEKSPEKILNESVSKCLVMKFIYSSVSKEKLSEAFEEGFLNNNPVLTEKLRPQVNQFLSFWSEMKEGDEAKIIYTPSSGTTVIIKEKVAGKILGGDFSRLLFSVWLGNSPPNKELKDGLLGR